MDSINNGAAMPLTPDNATDSQILTLTGDTPAVATRHRDLPIRVQIDPDVPVIELVGALAPKGLCLRQNHETGVLWLTKVTQ